MCDQVVSEYPFLLNYCPDRYKTHEMCNKALDLCLLAIKFVADWFLTSKMFQILMS